MRFLYYIKMNEISDFQTSNKSRKLASNYLNQKYDNQMNFFCAKPINDIIYNEHKNLSVIQSKSAVYYSDDTEYMRRIYHYLTESGKTQIFNRIQLLADFYSEIKTVTYQYPLMIMTNTKKIFMTRVRRLRKMKASDGSSDQSQIQNQEQQQFQSQGFLRSLKSQSQSLQRDSLFQSVKDRQSFDEQIHNIYKSDKGSITNAESTIQIVQIQREGGLQHLICDFNDIDPEMTLQNYQRLLDLGYQNQNKVPSKLHKRQIQYIHNNDRKKSQYSDLMTRIKNSHLGSNPRFLEGGYPESSRKKSYMANLLGCDLNFEKQKQIGKDFMPLNRDKNNTDNLQMIYNNRNQSNMNYTREQNQSRKQKIRDKAAELLNRVTSHNYMHSQNSSYQ